MGVLYVCGVCEFGVEGQSKYFWVLYGGKQVVVHLEGEGGVVLCWVWCEKGCGRFGGV